MKKMAKIALVCLLMFASAHPSVAPAVPAGESSGLIAPASGLEAQKPMMCETDVNCKRRQVCGVDKFCTCIIGEVLATLNRIEQCVPYRCDHNCSMLPQGNLLMCSSAHECVCYRDLIPDPSKTVCVAPPAKSNVGAIIGWIIFVLVICACIYGCTQHWFDSCLSWCGLAPDPRTHREQDTKGKKASDKSATAAAAAVGAKSNKNAKINSKS